MILYATYLVREMELFRFLFGWEYKDGIVITSLTTVMWDPLGRSPNPLLPLHLFPVPSDLGHGSTSPAPPASHPRAGRPRPPCAAGLPPRTAHAPRRPRALPPELRPRTASAPAGAPHPRRAAPPLELCPCDVGDPRLRAEIRLDPRSASASCFAPARAPCRAPLPRLAPPRPELVLRAVLHAGSRSASASAPQRHDERRRGSGTVRSILRISNLEGIFALWNGCISHS
ncbi:hypothetical protein PAHAL_9G243700 [Panicum hallii]|uniref:Uncharacterized protein n=1 Tax=Panicum hallii TaxID=206008 RepID=A0A2S3IM19_9POAL|nr:hypothetical protein PAHAL_9G243700 [Panicum hallii]